MASVRRLKPNDPKSPWIVEYNDGSGKRRRATPKSGLKKDAHDLRKKIEAELDSEVHTPKSESIKIVDLCDEFLKAQSQRVKDGRIGYERYRRLEGVLRVDVVPLLGNLSLADLKPTHADSLFRRIIDRGGSSNYARDKLKDFWLVEQHAVRRQYTKKTVTEAVLRDLRGIPPAKVDNFNRAEVVKLLMTASLRKHGVVGFTERGRLRLECYVNIAAFSGLRFGEICALSLDDVDFNARLLRVRHNLTGFGILKGPKTKAGVRDIPMPPHLRLLLSEWIEKHYRANDNRFVFWSTEPKAGDVVCGPRPKLRRMRHCDHKDYGKARGQWQQANFYKSWMSLLKRSGLYKENAGQFHFHALRHFCAAYWLENGMPLMDTAKLLGHSKPDITLEVYAFAMREEARQHEAIEEMAVALVPPLLLEAPRATKTRHSHVTA